MLKCMTDLEEVETSCIWGSKALEAQILKPKEPKPFETLRPQTETLNSMSHTARPSILVLRVWAQALGLGTAAWRVAGGRMEDVLKTHCGKECNFHGLRGSDYTAEYLTAAFKAVETHRLAKIH